MIRRTTKPKAREQVTPNGVTDRRIATTNEMSSELLARIKSEPGGGLSNDFLDNAFWRKEREPDDAWADALDRLDRLGDKKPLTGLLRSECELPPKAREYLADLIERGVRSPRGRPGTPSYRPSDAALLLDCKTVKAYVESGMSVKDALATASDESGRDPTTLANAYNGKHRSFNKSKKSL